MVDKFIDNLVKRVFALVWLCLIILIDFKYTVGTR